MSVIVSDLVFTYPKASRPTLNIGRMRFNSGEVTAVIGSNGAGKSTLFKCLTGFLKPSQGCISYGENIADRDSDLLIAQVFQNEQGFEHITVEEWILFNALLKKHILTADEIRNIINAAGLSGKERRKVPNLSGGEQRKLNLQCALIGSPQLLILDEPTVGLDQQARSDYWDHICKYKESQEGAILFTTHLMEEVERYSDYVYALSSSGQIMSSGTSEELIENLGVSLVAESDSKTLERFSSFSGRKYLDDGKCYLYIEDKNTFFDTYGLPEQLILAGIKLRKPDMTDVFRCLFEEHED